MVLPYKILLFHLLFIAISSFSLPVIVFSLFLLPECRELLLLWLAHDPFSESIATHSSFSSLMFTWLNIVEPVQETFSFSQPHAVAHVLANFFLALNCYSSNDNTLLFLQSASSFLSFVSNLHSNNILNFTVSLSDLDVICFHIYDIIRLGVHSLYLVDDPVAQALIPLNLPINQSSALAIQYILDFQNRIQIFINNLPSPVHSSVSSPLSHSSLPVTILDGSPRPSMLSTPVFHSSGQFIVPFSSSPNNLP